MSRILVCLAVVAALPCAHAQDSSEPVESSRPPYNRFAPPEAVDHVAIRIVTHATGPIRTEQVTVTRSGPWQRDDVQREGVTSTAYSDFERGVSVTWNKRDDGNENLHASQGAPGSPAKLVRVRTGETQRWAGEVCDVWAWRELTRTGFRSSTRSCLTNDGVELWQGHVGYDGVVDENFHVMTVQRRTVHPDEVRFPASALDWNRWRAGVAPGDITKGDEVTLTGSGRDGVDDVEITIRRRGDWTRTDANDPHDSRTIDISHDRASLYFSERDGERRLSLERHFGGRDRIGGEPVPYTPLRQAVILGRTCTWYDTMVGWSDVTGSDCRDETGAVLARGGTGWGGGARLSVQATQFSPSPPSADAFTPPRDIIAWVTE